MYHFGRTETVRRTAPQHPDPSSPRRLWTCALLPFTGREVNSWTMARPCLAAAFKEKCPSARRGVCAGASALPPPRRRSVPGGAPPGEQKGFRTGLPPAVEPGVAACLHSSATGLTFAVASTPPTPPVSLPRYLGGGPKCLSYPLRREKGFVLLKAVS